MEDAQRRRAERGPPVLAADRDPHAARDAIGEFVKSECRKKADYPFGDQERGLGKRLMLVDQAVGELVETATQAYDNALALEPRDGRRRRADLEDLAEARDPFAFEQIDDPVAVRRRAACRDDINPRKIA